MVMGNERRREVGQHDFAFYSSSSSSLWSYLISNFNGRRGVEELLNVVVNAKEAVAVRAVMSLNENRRKQSKNARE